MRFSVVNLDDLENPEFGKEDVTELVSFVLSWPQRWVNVQLGDLYVVKTAHGGLAHGKLTSFSVFSQAM